MKIYMPIKYIFWGLPMVAAILYFWFPSEEGNTILSCETKALISPLVPKDGGREEISTRSGDMHKEVLQEVTAQSTDSSTRYDDAVIEIAIEDIVAEKKDDLRVAPISAWHIEREKIETLTVGDTLVVPLEGIEYPLQVVHRERMGKSTVITAMYEDEGIRYPTVITIGKETLFVTFQTPGGGYQSSLISSEGYVYSNASIEAVWVDHSQSDTLKVTSNRDLDIIPR